MAKAIPLPSKDSLSRIDAVVRVVEFPGDGGWQPQGQRASGVFFIV